MTDIDMFKDMTYDTLNKQVDGNHYSKMKVQPAYFINENNLPFAEGNAIKYISVSALDIIHLYSVEGDAFLFAILLPRKHSDMFGCILCSFIS